MLCEKKKSDESFDLFYQLYPIKKHENRARAAWLSQRCWEKFEEIIKSLNELIEHDSAFIDGYAPTPDKWLMDERWKDKPNKRKKNGSREIDRSDNKWALDLEKDLF